MTYPYSLLMWITLSVFLSVPAQEWDDRDDDDVIVIERILLLIRNVLHVPPAPEEEKV